MQWDIRTCEIPINPKLTIRSTIYLVWEHDPTIIQISIQETDEHFGPVKIT